MPIDGFSPTTALAPTLSFAVKAFQTGYEFIDVPAQTKKVLETISQVTSNIQLARELRRRKSGVLEAYEKAKVDEAIQNTDKALATLAELVEQPRADMVADHGKVRVTSRLTWVLRDANNVQTALLTLGVVGGSLDREIIIMRCRGKNGPWSGEGDGNSRHGSDEDQAPPPYQATKELMYLKRQATTRRHLHAGETSPAVSSSQPAAGSPYSTPASEYPGISAFEQRVYPIFELEDPELAKTYSSRSASSLAAFVLPTISREVLDPQAVQQHHGEEPLPPSEVSMEAETLIPGRREPLLLKWNEPSDMARLNKGISSPKTKPSAPRTTRQMSWLEYQSSRPLRRAEDLTS